MILHGGFDCLGGIFGSDFVHTKQWGTSLNSPDNGAGKRCSLFTTNCKEHTMYMYMDAGVVHVLGEMGVIVAPFGIHST